MAILIYIDSPHSRISYTMDFVFTQVLGCDIKFTSNKSIFNNFEGKKISYSNSLFSCNYLQIIPSPLLSENKIRKFRTKKSKISNIPYIQFSGSDDFDPFSIIFFMISRYEEYWEQKKDVHGRFPAQESLAFQYDFLEFPIVDAWIDWIRQALNKTFTDFPPISKPAYHYLASYDIDHVRAYLWKGWKRTLGASIKDLFSFNISSFSERIKVILQYQNDPYNQFNYLDKIHHRFNINALYFWLIGNYGSFDKNPYFKHSDFRKNIHQVAQKYEIGIHPSYNSFLKKGQIKEEINRLNDILSTTKINKNRYHFLKFNLPESYRILLELGLTDDYSMAFPDALGFRAGTAHSFLWYDLEKEAVSNLRIHPFQIMDVTLKNYLGLSPKMALERTKTIINHSKNYGGCLVTLWHNSSFDDKEWKNWKAVYEQIVVEAQDNSNS